MTMTDLANKRAYQPEIWMPTAWPLFWRRAFFITFPISAPAWLIIVGAYGALMMAACFLLVLPWLAFCSLKEMLWDRPTDSECQNSEKTK